MDTVWLSYDELADRLGITKPSARTLAKRHKWPRRAANDGTARVGVPSEYLGGRPMERPGGRSQDQPLDQPPECPQGRPEDRPQDHPLERAQDHDAVAITILSRHIERLESQLDAAMKRAEDRDQIASRCDTLSVQLDALRAALDAANQDRDRWHAAATARRSWWPFRRAS
jgi:hypothetical protein